MYALTNIDMLFIILSYLDIFDLLYIQQTSQKFRQASRKVIEVNIGYYFGFLVSKKFSYFQYDFADIFSRIELPYDILSTIIKAKFTKKFEGFGIHAHMNTGCKGRGDTIFDKNEIDRYNFMTIYEQLEPDKLPCLHYKSGHDNLVVVYSFQESKKFIRIHRDEFRDHTLVVSGNFDDSLQNIEPFLIWKNAEMMFVIHKDFVKEKTPEGKYYITWSNGNNKIREECHLMTFHDKDLYWKVDGFFPKNRESLLSMDPAYITYFNIKIKYHISCGLCLSKKEISDSKCVLDLLDNTENENMAKKRKLSNTSDDSTGEIDVIVGPLDDMIQMGISHYCYCTRLVRGV